MTATTRMVCPAEICQHVPWNSRQDYTESPLGKIPGDRANTSQLAESIAIDGMIQPPGVTERDEPCEVCGNTLKLLWGFRRVRSALDQEPDTPILVLVRDADDHEARVLNLAENLHRRDLKPWELAEALTAIQDASPELSYAKIAKQVNLSKPHVANLIRLRRNLHPQIWDQYKRWGSSLRVNVLHLLEICALDHDDQLSRYKLLVAERQENHGKRGQQARPGPRKLSRYLREIDDRYPSRSVDWKKGFRHALRVALGDTEPSTKKKAQKRKRSES